ncbi:hypothetical protein PRZ48_011176 [Zasmidium cellare]|uniref:Uncharacterized protein n=1 Tax=Zasmidium cellare TaxID=395010 RepID=A0ABR0EBT4_ZASCE|nr:hypothetical protein PRZ48_011176 [Zasmidium cellare]
MDDLEGKYVLSGPLDRSANYEEYISKAGSAGLPSVSISPHDMVNVQFTSGLPKSVALSHYNIMNCGRYIWQQTRMTEQDRICLPVPLFHSFGMIVGISSSTVAGSALILPSEIYNASKTLQCIQDYKCTAIYGVPTMFVTEMEKPEFDSIDRLYTCWGMTELSSFVTMMHETDPYEKRIKTAGRLFPHFVAKIVQPDTGKVLPWGEKGEIVASGYGQMSEYLNNKEKTDETLRYHQEDLEPGGVGGLGDGTVLRKWMHTGDEGFLDPEGYFIISGRIKDLIIRGGENISPMEIEDRLVEHEAVVQASIVGVPDDKYGEELGAFIELRQGCKQPSEDELRAFVREKLARFKAPRYFFWLGDGKAPDEWPKTTSGKVSKPDLRKMVKSLL